MIIKEWTNYTVYCDGCEEQLIPQLSFDDALDVIVNNEWKTVKEEGSDWEHYCPECQWNNEEEE